MVLDGTLYWITGLSGAGKTTIGKRLFSEIQKFKKNVVLLDGDEIKEIVSDSISYSDAGRRNRAMKYARLCNMLTKQGIIVICCTISMYHEVREWNRIHNRSYVEVFLNVPLDVLRNRDQKNLYSDYKKGISKNIAGEDLMIEFPRNPDVEIVNDGGMTIEECVRIILRLNTNNKNEES